MHSRGSSVGIDVGDDGIELGGGRTADRLVEVRGIVRVPETDLRLGDTVRVVGARQVRGEPGDGGIDIILSILYSLDP